jgi:hypothetical protein
MSVSSRHSPRAKIPVSVQTPQSTPAVLIWAIAATRCHGIRLPGYALYLRNLRQSTIYNLARGKRGAYPSIDAQPKTVSAPDLAPHRRLATASRQGVYLTTGCKEGVLGGGTSTGRDTQAITE